MIVLLRPLRHIVAQHYCVASAQWELFLQRAAWSGKHDPNIQDAQGLQHVNGHVPVPMSTAHGSKQQLTAALSILTPYVAVHCKKNKIVYMYVNKHSGVYILCVYVCMYMVYVCISIFSFKFFLQFTASNIYFCAVDIFTSNAKVTRSCGNIIPSAKIKQVLHLGYQRTLFIKDL